MNLAKEIQATTELLRICEEDGREDAYVSSIRSCLESLRQGNLSGAAMHFRCVPLGGMGRFDDWQPANASNAAIFDTLVQQWTQLMRPHVPIYRCACCGWLRHKGPCFSHFGN